MKIAILTSGGDAPGMNAAIRAVVRSAQNLGYEVYGVKNGYEGLINNDIELLSHDSVSGMLSKGGTFLGTARSKRFEDIEYKKIAYQNLEDKDINALVAIGGDGTALGALSLHNLGTKVIAIPGSIDNDVGGTDFAIGFHTALDTISDSIDKIRDTSSSHQRCSIIETMGRNSGALAAYAGVCGGAEMVITKEHMIEKDVILKKMTEYKKLNRKHVIIVITEHICDVHALADEITEKTNFTTRATVLGHIQRGGNPVPADRILATQLGTYAVELLDAGHTGVAVGIKNNKLTFTDITKSVKEKKNNSKIYELITKTA